MRLNHNTFALITVAAAALFLAWLVGAHEGEPIPLAELTGLRVLPAAMYVGTTFLLCRFLGGWDFRTWAFLKTDAVAFAVALAGLLVGLGLVLAGR